MKGRGRDKRGPPDAEDTTASRQNAHGRVALVATGKGYGRDKRGPPEHGLSRTRPPPQNTASRARPDIWYNMQNFGSQ